MRLNLPPSLWPPRRDLLGRRAIGVILAIIVHILGFFLLLSLAPQSLGLRKPEPELKRFPLLPLSERPAPKPPAPRASAARKTVEATPPRVPPVPPTPLPPLNMMIVSSEVFKASDISKIRPQRAEAVADNGPSGSGGAAEGPGEGPGGEKLYPADWYKEPTTAEMAYYLPKGRPQAGWGMIACKTAADFRVEDCRELGESPMGSGLSRSLRQAAWQFRVRPPRVGGKPQIGVWVRILFDFQVGVVR